jgi:hypothetical protein
MIVRGHVVLAAVIGVVPLACGSSGSLSPPDGGHDAAAADASLDATDAWAPGSDAGIDSPEETPDVEAPDVGPPVPCEAGNLYIAVEYDGGSSVLRSGCGLSPDVPTLLVHAQCGEDCSASWVCGSSDAGALSLPIFGSPGICVVAAGIGVYRIEGNSCGGSWRFGPQTLYDPGGQVRLKTFPDGGGTVSGDYTAVYYVDGGQQSISGTFCLLRGP